MKRITPRKRDEEEWSRSRESLAATLACMADAVITTDVDGLVVGMNPAAERLTGWSEAEAIRRPLEGLVSFGEAETSLPIENFISHVLEARPAPPVQIAIVARDGSRIPVNESGAQLRDSSGSIRGTVLVLRNVAEERRLNEMLQHSQRMEVLGRLAAGVAHDFNNLLTVIIGCAEVLLAKLPASDPDRSRAELILDAGERASSLTRQLLAIGRRQVLAPVTLDLNEVVKQEEEIIGRVIGEDVEVNLLLELRPWYVRADPALLGQVIMNLAVNARDAMPRGGRLTMQTVNVELDDAYEQAHLDIPAGRYVMMSVSDTGIGMDAATRARIFEPFFTTKEPGKGTGLGLATVFGVVRQHHGHIWVYSEPGHGTTFKIYLPAVDDGSPELTAPSDPKPVSRGTETILLVEDDDVVREITADSLRLYGYTVIEASNGIDAIETCRTCDTGIDLLLSDVIMPGLGGAAVAQAVLAMRPGVRILFLSGYTEEDASRHGIDIKKAAFLQKPFTAGLLARKVREVLGGSGDQGRGASV